MATDIKRHSAIAHAAYHDLLRGLKDDQISEIRGTPVLRTRGARGYWYDSYRVGDKKHERYLQEDNAEFRAKLEQIELLRGKRDERRKERSRLVRLLRAEGFVSVDGGTARFLGALSDARFFRLGGTLVGTNAFRLF